MEESRREYDGCDSCAWKFHRDGDRARI
jgi:hypothetical protein